MATIARTSISVVSGFRDTLPRIPLAALSLTVSMSLVPISNVFAQVFPLWEARFNSGFNVNEGKAIAVDQAGNVYVTGTGYGGVDNSRHYVTIKYNAAGNEVWVDRYFAPGNSIAVAIAVDRNGEIYVTGESQNSSDNFDFLTIKYNADGEQQWLRRYDSRPGWDDRAIAMAVDSAGNVFVTGSSDSASTNPDFLTIGYTSSGSLVWAERYNAEGTSRENPRAIAADISGNVYVTGTVLAPSTNVDCATVSYGPGGAMRWVQRYGGSGSQTSSEAASALALDAAGNLYVGGRENSGGLLIKYASDGTEQWRRHDSTVFQGDVSLAVLAGTVYLAAPAYGGSVGGTDYVTIKYDSSGNRHWLRQFNATGNGPCAPKAIGVDDKMNVYVTGSGFFGWANSGSDYLTIKYDSAGAQKWVQQYSGSGTYPDAAVDVVVDHEGTVYVTGASGAPVGYECATVAYAQGMRVTDPRPGERWYAGEQDTIRWRGRPLGQVVEVQYSPDDGQTYSTISSPVLADSFIWAIPASELTTRAKIRVVHYTTPADTAVSDTFRVKGYVMTRMGPDGQYQPYTFAVDRWSFGNVFTQGGVWNPTYWAQFDYQTGRDLYTSFLYPQDWYLPFGSATSSDFPPWPVFVRAFGVEACYFGVGTSLMFYRPSAMLRWKVIKTSGWNGSCLGFAVSSILAFDDASQFLSGFPELSPFNNLVSVALTDSARKVIHALWARQFGREHQEFLSASYVKTPNQTIRDLKELLGGDRQDRSYLLLANNNVGGGAHAVVPYSLQRDPNDARRYFINVYDNSYFTNANARFIVDTTGNSGNGSWTCVLWPTWGGNHFLFLMDASSTYLTLPELTATGQSAKAAPTTRRMTQGLTVYPGLGESVRIADKAGQAIGFVDSVVVDSMAGAIPYTPATGSQTPPYAYLLPGGEYSILLSDFKDAGASVGVFSDSGIVYYARQDASADQSDMIWYGGGLSTRNTNPSDKRLEIQNVVIEPGAEKQLSIYSYVLARDESLFVRVEDHDRLKIANVGGAKTYDLALLMTSEAGTPRFEHPGIALASNSSHQVSPEWTDLHQTVKIYVDTGNNGTIDDTVEVDNAVADVDDWGAAHQPDNFYLAQNYPNPFNPSTTIRYGLPERSHVTLTVYNTLGQQVATLVEGEKEAGYHEVMFDASHLASGVYLYRLRAGSFVEMRKMTVLR